ncbi:MAG TPA: glycoside hydrolase family 6 protein [Solirubrobacteraceae bacterium]|nr:glycoside hydrolase family 6 protein [Solirubrobacteraceae bacterium]
MSPRHIKPLALIVVLGSMLMFAANGRAAVARDSGSAAGTVSLDQSAYTAHESQGTLAITIVRTGNLLTEEHVGYGVKQQDAQDGIDFTAIPSTYITMAPGQSTYTFDVPIIDQGINATPVHALAYLYHSVPDSIGTTNSLITIQHDDPVQTRDPANPLGVPAPADANPVAGAKLFVDPQSPAAQAEAHTSGAAHTLLGEIAGQPGAHRFYMWNMGPNVAGQVAHWLQGTQLEQPGTTVMLSSYNLVHGPCGSTTTPAMQATYDAYMHQLAAGIGNYHVIYFLEFDSLITSPCLTSSQLAIREGELRDAVSILEADPHVVVYLDGGAADAIPARHQAALLRASGVAQAQGFFLNSTHFDWTSKEIHYGQQISNMLGGTHFIVNTGENGRGPLVPRNRVKHGNEVLCNPSGRALGPLSLSQDDAQQTGYAGLDGLLWFSNPGGSGGQCVRGAPPAGTFWPAYAEMLARNWVNSVSGPHFRLRRVP